MFSLLFNMIGILAALEIIPSTNASKSLGKFCSSAQYMDPKTLRRLLFSI